MGKQRKQCWSGKSVNPQKKHRGEKKTPESLMAQGDFQEAIRLLRGHIRATPLDAKKRLLGECLFELGQYQEAAATWLTIQDKTVDDLLGLSAVSLNIKDWEQAIQFLNESLQREEKGYAYYLLAMAHLQDKRWYSVDTKTKRIALDFLQHARALSECPAHGYVLLDHILWSLALDEARGEDDKVQNQMREQARKETGLLLEEALQIYPDNDEIRLELVKNLNYRKQYETALEFLAPLVDQAERSEEAIAVAIDASIGAQLFEKAHQYLDALPSNPHTDGQSHEASRIKLRGDLFLYQANLGQALACYEQERQGAAFVDKFIGAFSCAWVWLLQEQKEKAIASAKEGAEVWFAQNDSLERHYGLDALPISIGMIYISDESPALCVKQVCELLLADNTLADTTLKGQLSYLLYQYYITQYERRASDLWTQKPEARQLLLQAAQLHSHPLMSDELISLFLNMGDIPQAITHHLISCTFSFTHEPEDFVEEYAEFAYEKVSIATEDERRKVHEAAFNALERCTDVGMIEAVFLPFFISFWCPLLQEGQMIQELVAVTKILIDSADEANIAWFYHAWGLSELDQNDEAERTYRQLLEHTPEDADALHNLALLVEEKGHVQEALELSSRAAKLAPNDELIVSKYNQLKGSKYKEREPIYSTSPEQAQRWSSLSDSQKRLLCLLELHPATYWSALLTHIRNEESQVRQLQEDWEWLLAQEVCTQTDAEMPVQVVPQLRPYVWSEGFNYWLAAEIAREQLRRKKNLWLPDAAGLGYEQLAVLSETQRDLLQKVLIKHMDRISLSGLEHCFLRFYRRIWKKLLIEWKMYAALVDLCKYFLNHLSVMNRQELWECAYYATDLSSFSHQNIAEKLYKEYLAQGEDYSTYHNLAVIYFRKKKYQEALQMIDQALRLEPSKDIGVNLKTNIERAIAQEAESQRQHELQLQQEKEQREQRIKDLEQSVQEHLTDVDYPKKNILRSLKNAPYFRGKQSFAKYIKMEELWLEWHWKKLVSWGMIVETDEGPIVHPLVCGYLEQGWPITFKSRDKTPELADNIDRLAQVLTGLVVTSPTKRNEDMPMVKTLFLAANPLSTTRLAIDEEMRAIEQKVRAAEHRDVLIFQSAWAVRPDDLLQKLNECRPHIVHFSGHGSHHGLCLAGDNGLERLVTTRALTHLFSALKDNIRLVFLNSCYSREQAQALVANIDCVIGMTKSIHDNAAKIFASSFYRAIGFGRSIQEAFNQGIAALLLEDVSDEEVPELLTREGIDPSQIVLIKPSAKLHAE